MGKMVIHCVNGATGTVSWLADVSDVFEFV